MINLFNVPNYTIDTSKFDNFLHDKIVEEFEEEFCEYVGANFGCSINSATNAIFLSLYDKDTTVNVPSMIPPVVLNAVIQAGNKIFFTDDPHWLGDSYILHEFEDYKIIDSAQKVERNQFRNEANPHDLMIFSFYPTKPVGSCDGGMVVSNDKNKIRWFKEATMNGTMYTKNSWERKIVFPGWKMYMNSLQAYIAKENLRKLDEKKERLSEIRDMYNKEFGYDNQSDHLYRIYVSNRDDFIRKMSMDKIICGIHYEPQHINPVYMKYIDDSQKKCPVSRIISAISATIPFHEKLTEAEIQTVIGKIHEYGNF